MNDTFTGVTGVLCVQWNIHICHLRYLQCIALFSYVVSVESFCCCALKVCSTRVAKLLKIFYEFASVSSTVFACFLKLLWVLSATVLMSIFILFLVLNRPKRNTKNIIWLTLITLLIFFLQYVFFHTGNMILDLKKKQRTFFIQALCCEFLHFQLNTLRIVCHCLYTFPSSCSWTIMHRLRNM